MKKTPRSCRITAIAHADKAIRATFETQRATIGKHWGYDSDATCHDYKITSSLRMIRCLWLQSAFLARGGTLK